MNVNECADFMCKGGSEEGDEYETRCLTSAFHVQLDLSQLEMKVGTHTAHGRHLSVHVRAVYMQLGMSIFVPHSEGIGNIDIREYRKHGAYHMGL